MGKEKPNLSTDFLTSRSAIECYQECPRERLLRYHLDGTGYVPGGANVYFSTGSAIHKGCEFLLNFLKTRYKEVVFDKEHVKFNRDIREEAVKVAIQEYQKLTKDGIVGGKIASNTEIQSYIKAEQVSLVEALVRAWGLREFPQIARYFRVIAVEMEEASKLCNGVWLEGKADALLRDNETKGFLVYSLKSIKLFDWRVEKSYKTDLQGITEIWLMENHLATLKQSNIKYKTLSTRVSGVKFCFLIKGDRREVKDNITGKGTGLWETSNSLIKGWRKFEANRMEYAHSYWFENYNNKSGKGRLGKGWEGFNSWELEKMGVRGWMDLLVRKQVQPELGDIVKEYVVTPGEYWRNKEEIEESISEIALQESIVKANLDKGGIAEEIFPITFPKHRKSCWYPQDCDYVGVCHEGKDIRELVEGGEFKRRESHHKLEREQHKI